MKNFDKCYITFVFDDNNSMFTNECYQIFKEYNMPMCCAVIANQVEKSSFLISLLKDIENSGGEILSHTYDHTVFVEGTTIETVEYQLKQSFAALRSLGFNVNGIIETGNGGGEKLADYQMIESVTRKYYKYSNAYGVSSQYKKSRIWFFNNTVESIKSIIDKAVTEKQWIVLSAHNFNEMPKEDLIEILNYIKAKGKENIEVVNWNYIYENFGEYSGTQIPTSEALAAVDEYNTSDTYNQNTETSSSITDSSMIQSSQSEQVLVENNSDNKANDNKGLASENIVWLLSAIIIFATIAVCCVALFLTFKYIKKI